MHTVHAVMAVKQIGPVQRYPMVIGPPHRR